MYAIGRVGATRGLNLEQVGLIPDSRGRLTVNEHFQTAVPHIYAAGDIIGFPALASTSMDQGRVAIAHMYDTRDLDSVPKIFPYGIYTVPEVSMVGMTEQEAISKGISYENIIAEIFF